MSKTPFPFLIASSWGRQLVAAWGSRGGSKGLGPKTPSAVPGGKKQRLDNHNNNNSSHPYGVLQFTRTIFSYFFIGNETHDSLAWEAQDSEELFSIWIILPVASTKSPQLSLTLALIVLFRVSFIILEVHHSFASDHTKNIPLNTDKQGLKQRMWLVTWLIHSFSKPEPQFCACLLRKSFRFQRNRNCEICPVAI